MVGSSFFLRVNGLVRFKAPVFSPEQVRAIGAAAIDTLNKRLDNGLNLNDAPAKPYSRKGPIYVPVTGPGRTKSSLGGREVLSTKDLRAIKKLGAGSFTRTASGRSAKFANREAYKLAIGRSGRRDLYQSGKMRGAIAVVSVSGSAATIGFTRDEERLKAQGNQNIEAWMGLSPNDRKAVIAFAKTLLPNVKIKVA